MDDTILEEMEFSKAPNKPQKIIKETRVRPENIEKSVEAKTRELDLAQKNLVNVYKNEKKVPVRVAPSYARYFGRVMRVAINGISVAVRCDGSTVNLPESFAAEVLRRMYEMDKYDLRLNKMARVEHNLESSPGQLNFFG
jgi:hypothetical protein